MGRDYFGFIDGRIPRSITNELPFLDMCCTFEGYLARFEKCGCLVYEYDDFRAPKLYTECRCNGNHKIITRDTSMAKWSIHRSSIYILKEKLRCLELINITDDDDIRIDFMRVVITQLLEAFDKYYINNYITFTSECV